MDSCCCVQYVSFESGWYVRLYLGPECPSWNYGLWYELIYEIIWNMMEIESQIRFTLHCKWQYWTSMKYMQKALHGISPFEIDCPILWNILHSDIYCLVLLNSIKMMECVGTRIRILDASQAVFLTRQVGFLFSDLLDSLCSPWIYYRSCPTLLHYN